MLETLCGRVYLHIWPYGYYDIVNKYNILKTLYCVPCHPSSTDWIILHYNEDNTVIWKRISQIRITDGKKRFRGEDSYCWIFNPFPHTTILQQTTLNICCQIIENLYNWIDNLWLKVENIVAKEEIAQNEQFLLLSLCFQKAVCCRGDRKRLYEGKG